MKRCQISCLFGLGLLGLIWLALPAVRGQSPADGVAGQRFALLVGVSEYEAEKLNNQFSASDVNAVKDQLLETGFAPENITVLASGAKISQRPSKRRAGRRASHSLGKQSESITAAANGAGIPAEWPVSIKP